MTSEVEMMNKKARASLFTFSYGVSLLLRKLMRKGVERGGKTEYLLFSPLTYQLNMVISLIKSVKRNKSKRRKLLEFTSLPCYSFLCNGFLTLLLREGRNTDHLPFTILVEFNLHVGEEPCVGKLTIYNLI